METIQQEQEQGFVQTTERRVEDTLKDKEKKEYLSFMKSLCCGSGMIGQIVFLLIFSGIDFVFVIAAIATSIRKNAAYLILHTLYCPLDNILNDYLGGAASSLLAGFSGNDSSLKTFWCGIGSFEDGVLISYLIFIILFIGFEILSLLIHKQVIKLSIEEEGILYYILIGTNSIFLVIFYIFTPLLNYLFIYIIIIIATTPNSSNNSSNSQSGTESVKDPNEESWKKNNPIPVVNLIFVVIITIFHSVLLKVKKSIILYLSMRYDNDNINLKNEKTKKKTVRINNDNVEFEIQANQVTYLERVDQKDKIYKFKKIKINQIANEFFIYLFINNKAIEDQISLTDWEIPIYNELFLKLSKIASYIYGMLYISIPLFKLHLSNEYNYFYTANMYSSLMMGISDNTIKRPTFYGVYSIYGSFELGTANSRFALYVVALLFVLLSMGKRIIYGGYTRPIIILICFIFSAIFILENVIYAILSFLMFLFSIFSFVCFKKISKDNDIKDNIIQIKFIFQIFLNISIFILCITILIDNIRLTTILNKLRKEFNHLNDGTEPEEQEKIEGFQYQGLDNKSHILNEIIIEGHPRYIYYNLYGDIRDVPTQPIIISKSNPLTNPQNNPVNVLVNRSHLHNNTHTSHHSQNNRNRRNSKKNTNHRNSQNNLITSNDAEADLIAEIKENQKLKDENKRLKEEITKLKNSLNNILNLINN